MKSKPSSPLHPGRSATFSGMLLMLATLSACAQGDDQTATQPPSAAPDSTAIAIFAGGCFWCMEPPYDKIPGVISTTSGYIGGHVANPTYRQVTTGRTGHTESVKVEYDPSRVRYEQLLEVFWRNIDPIAVDRQFCDVGSQYRSEIFPTSPEQKKLAEASKQSIATRFDQPIATKITEATTFYPAESYHQDYYKKNPVQYKFYRWNCGRDKRLNELWGEPK